MILKESKIPEDSLLAQAPQADYTDAFCRDISGKAEITPDELFQEIFIRTPGWVDALMKLRNVLVKPFGLETGNLENKLTNRIKHRSEQEIILGMDDKHLSFDVSLLCRPKSGETQRVILTTTVRYNRAMGKVYFFFVRPFHRFIVRSALGKL